jgi:hypothetical protein
LSTITGVLGFADHPEVPKAMLLPILPSLPEATGRPNGVFPAETGMSDLDVSQMPRTPSDDKLSSPDLGSGDPYLHGRGMLSPLPSSLQENSVHQRSGSRSLFKWKTDGDYQNSKGSGDIRLVCLLLFNRICDMKQRLLVFMSRGISKEEYYAVLPLRIWDSYNGHFLTSIRFTLPLSYRGFRDNHLPLLYPCSPGLRNLRWQCN